MLKLRYLAELTKEELHKKIKGPYANVDSIMVDAYRQFSEKATKGQIEQLEEHLEAARDAVRESDAVRAALQCMLAAFTLAYIKDMRWEIEYEQFVFGLSGFAISFEDDIVKGVKSKNSKDATDSRHQNRREILERAKVFVSLDLDGNCNPNWTTADYTNEIRKDIKNNKRDDHGNLLVSDDALKEAIRAIFKERGLAHRIATGPARHVKRQK